VVTTAHPEPTPPARAFHVHAGAVARFLRRMGVAAIDLDDLVQEVFLAAHARGGYREGAASERSWYLRLAWYAVVGHRRRSRLLPQSLAECEPASDAGQQRTVEARERLARVAAALDRLTPHHRAVLVLADVEGYSADETAAALEIPVGTVYSRLHHARRRFADALRSDETPRPATSVALGWRSP
jgi:RNA polymerase sigma-70 factor (ECF subfamily)